MAISCKVSFNVSGRTGPKLASQVKCSSFSMDCKSPFNVGDGGSSGVSETAVLSEGLISSCGVLGVVVAMSCSGAKLQGLIFLGDPLWMWNFLKMKMNLLVMSTPLG